MSICFLRSPRVKVEGLGCQAQCWAHLRAWGPRPLYLGCLRILRLLGSPNWDLHLLRVKLGKLNK